MNVKYYDRPYPTEAGPVTISDDQSRRKPVGTSLKTACKAAVIQSHHATSPRNTEDWTTVNDDRLRHVCCNVDSWAPPNFSV